jgi:hypothetical protein
MFLDQPALSQPATENYSASNSHRRLLEIEKRVVTICQDLTQIRKSLDISDPDKEFVVDLWIACQTTADYVSNAVAVLWLYTNMSLGTDRKKVENYVGELFKNVLAAHLEVNIEQTNFAIANTKKPGIVSTATQLKDAIRQAIDVLNAVRL